VELLEHAALGLRQSRLDAMQEQRRLVEQRSGDRASLTMIVSAYFLRRVSSRRVSSCPV
jgi:hypothetical protein